MSLRSRLGDYLELTKPRLSALVLATTLVGYVIAETGPFRPVLLLTAMLGAALVVAGANVMNQVHERQVDALMSRTRNRPLPGGRLWARPAGAFGLVVAAAGVLVLATGVNATATLLGLAGFILYAIVYTPLKRVTVLCTFIGAIPGAIPPMIGWAVARGGLDAEAAGLFAVLLLWQIPHFFAIARLYRHDYRKAGMVMLGLDERGRPAYLAMIAFCIVLIPTSMSLSWLGTTGELYLVGAAILGMVFLGFIVRAAILPGRKPDRDAFLASTFYLWALLGLMILDRPPPL